MLDKLSHRGGTNIYSAIIEACRVLAPIFHSDPTHAADLRVILLTDGMGNDGHKAQAAFEAAQSINATCDALLVGGSHANANVRLFSEHTPHLFALQAACHSASHCSAQHARGDVM